MHSIPNIPDTLACEIYAELRRTLPAPPDDTPQARQLREQLAMAAVAHFLPENVAEATVAIHIVAAQTYARDALRAAARSGTDPDQLRQARAWATSMMRQADSGIRTLLRMQAERQKAEDALRPAAMQRAGYWFRSVSTPEPAHSPAAPVPDTGLAPEPDPTEPAGFTREAAEAVQPPAEPPKLEYGAMTAAERFVTLYPDRAAAVLAAGGLPAGATFAPPGPDVLDDLLTSNSPLVRAFRQARSQWPATGPATRPAAAAA